MKSFMFYSENFMPRLNIALEKPSLLMNEPIGKYALAKGPTFKFLFILNSHENSTVAKRNLAFEK